MIASLAIAAAVGSVVMAGEQWLAPPAPTPTPTPSATPTPTPTPTPVPTPTPDPGAARLVAGADYDFAQPVPESEPVEDAYFADAAFIGDSRTDGFRMFSGLTQGDFIVKTGLSVFHVANDTLTFAGEKMTALEALGLAEREKVYLCMGINELGMYNDNGYYSHYADFIDAVRAQQPQATIYVQLLIPVNAQKCEERKMPSYITNEQIAVYNGLLYQLAQEKRVFLVDPAQDLVDETGEPPYDTVADGVHFKQEPYQKWFEYLKRHTVDKGEWE